jgi:hypothetical protein
MVQPLGRSTSTFGQFVDETANQLKVSDTAKSVVNEPAKKF